jgi:hypothetical protein
MRTRVAIAFFIAAALTAAAAEFYVGSTVGVAATGGLAREDYLDGWHDAEGAWFPLFGGVRGDARFGAYDVKAEAVVLWPFNGVYRVPDASFDERAVEFGVIASGGRCFGADPVYFRLGVDSRWVYADVDYANYPSGSYTVNDVLVAPVGGLIYDADLLRFNFNTGFGFAGVYMGGHFPETDPYLSIIWEAEAAFKLRQWLTMNVGVTFLDDVYGFDRGWADRSKFLISGGRACALAD